MGHEIIVYRDRHLVINDLDFWAIRHFILIEAEKSASLEIATFLRGWEWIGPGVYVGVEFDYFFNGHSQREESFAILLSAARIRIESFGEAVPLDYIEKNINLPGFRFTSAQPTHHWVRQIEEISEILAPSIII